MKPLSAMAFVGIAAGLVITGCGGASKPKTDMAFCALARSQEAQTEMFNEAFATGKPSDVKPVVDGALAQYARFQDAAPPEIAGAVRSYVSAERAFLTIIKNNGYDVTKDQAGLAKAVEDPAFIKAGQQLTTYLMTTCKLGSPASATPTTGG